MAVLNILLIDDDEDEYVFTRSLLVSKGVKKYNLTWEGDYHKAQKLLKEQSFDIYLVDFHLGPKTGFDLLNETFGMGTIFKPVIILTGQSMSDHELDFVKNGASDYLHKSELNSQNIERSIRYALERYHSLVERFQNQQFYQNLFYEAHYAHFIMNPAFEITNVNRAFTRLFRLSQGAAKGMHISTFFENRDDFENFESILVNSKHLEELETILLADSIPLQCLVRWSEIYHSDGTLSSYHCTIQDITERQKTQRENQLADKYAMTGRISRMIAHEVRNPLTNIKLAMLQIDVQNKEDKLLQTYSDIVVRNADRINDLITSLLNASIPAEVQLNPMKIEKCLKTAIDEVKDRATLKGIDIEEQFDNDLPLVKVDENRLTIAITNLLVNATEAIEKEDGRIQVSTTFLKEKDKIQITVSDNGQGMTQETQDKLFEPFFSKKKSGTGLGLSTTLNIIKAHEGSMSCSSVVGQGTTFYIELNTA